MMVFTEEALIIEVEKYKVLYDLGEKMYYDSKSKENAWLEISERLDIEVEACKKKWKALREGFRKSKLRRKTVSGQEAKPSKPWKYEKEMAFLELCKDSRDQHSNIPSLRENEDNYEGGIEENDEEMDDTGTSSCSKQDTSTTHGGSQSSTEHSGYKKQKKQLSGTAEVLQQYLKKKEEKRDMRESIQSKNDHIHQFFSACEGIFRTLPGNVQPDARVEIMHLFAKYENQSLWKNVSASFQEPSQSSTISLPPDAQCPLQPPSSQITSPSTEPPQQYHYTSL